ncbi:MAG: hypothetical protein K6G92_04195 [Bacteroidaceae bacterium]|nr:hypothetical protein [Bacteroidaceae bacterium]
MKRITLLAMLVALFSVTTFAQVTPPATATAETWYTADGKFQVYGRYGWEDYTAMMSTINIAIDGSDIYVQGLSYYFKDGWIKGTVSGNTATFEGGQVVGQDEYGTEYICGSNDGQVFAESIVFNYDAEKGILEAVTPLVLESGSTESFSIYAYWQVPTFTREKPKGPEPVVAPEGLVADEWAVSAKDNYGVPVSTYFYIGFDGNDVYLKGFTHYLPDTWLKGTLSEDGKTITFPGNQYFGPYDADSYTHYEFYLMQDGFELTYDAEAGKMTGQGELYVSEAIRQYKGDVYNDPVITKVVEKAAIPATPNISQIYDATTAPVVMFTIPATDVNGDAMLSSKVSFQFFKDIEQEVSPVVFEPADYPALTEAMTVFPYGFTDDNFLFYNYMYLNQADYGKWNKIGLQVTYTGGGEENKSEIFWFDIKPYEMTIFDFNAMTDEPCSSSVSNDGDITENRVLTANNMTLTVSPKAEEATTPNRFWSTSKGPQLRIYSGTLTFEAPIGKVITKLVFNNGKWDEGNSADSGQFEGNVWTGEAKKVVVTIAGNTQLNSIVVYPSEYVPTAVDAPADLATDTYIFSAKSEKPYYDPADLTLWVKAGFDGDDLYIQGLAADLNSSADQLWVKATKNEAGQYVIPANQYMGNVTFWMSSMDYYFTAVNANGKMVDAVLDFDAEKGQFTSAQALVINAALTELIPQQTFTNVVITKFNEMAATPADPVFNNVDFGEWSHGINCTIPTVGTEGETLNPGKLFYTVWVEKNGEQTPYTFTAEMYYAFDEDATEVSYATNYSTWDGSHSIYFYDDASVFGDWTKVGIQSIYYGAGERKESNIVWQELSGTGIVEMYNGQCTMDNEIYNLAGQRLNATRKGINIINGKKVVIK